MSEYKSEFMYRYYVESKLYRFLYKGFSMK